MIEKVFSVAFLITYPKEKVEPELQSQLAKITVPLYLPLRELVATQLTSTEVSQIRSATGIVITSQFALQVYLSRDWHATTQPEFFVLSQKMAAKLQAKGFTQVTYPVEENQASLAQLLASLPAQQLLWLTGNRHIKHNQLAVLPHLTQLTCYKNSWSQTQEDQVVSQLKGHQITRILVTSPSSYTRLQSIEARLASQFSSVTYYTLGHSTFKLISKAEKRVIQPLNKQYVLRQMLQKMCHDEVADQ
jgi:uroporphyrinogen-III synthase